MENRKESQLDFGASNNKSLPEDASSHIDKIPRFTLSPEIQSQESPNNKSVSEEESLLNDKSVLDDGSVLDDESVLNDESVSNDKSLSTNKSPFLTLPTEIRCEIYKLLAVDTILKKVAMSTGEMKTPPILFVSKLIRRECSEEFRKHASFILNIPVTISSDTSSGAAPSACPTLDVAFPRTPIFSGRHLSLKLTLILEPEMWWGNGDTHSANASIKSAQWFNQLLTRLQASSEIQTLSIRWALPSPLQSPSEKALHSIFNALVETVEVMPNLQRYSIQIGYDSFVVAVTPKWGIAILSAYGRRSGGKSWEDESTVRYCCQEMPRGEWYALLSDLQLDPMKGEEVVVAGDY